MTIFNKILNFIIGFFQSYPISFGFLAGLISILSHSVIINNGFFHDDFIHFYDINTLTIKDFIIKPFGGHIYLVRNSIYYVFYSLFKINPLPYHCTTLLIHGINVVLLFYITKLFIKSLPISFFLSTLWGINILNQSTLGWYSAFGHVLCCTFVLILFLDLGKIYSGIITTISIKKQIKWILLHLLAINCYGVAIPVAMGFWILLLAIIPPGNHDKKRVIFVNVLIAIVVPILFYYAYRTIDPTVNFETRFMVKNSIKMIIGVLDMVSYGVTGIFSGPILIFSNTAKITDFTIQWSYIKYFIYILTAILLLASLCKLKNQNRHDRLITLSIGIICVACFSIIILGRLPRALIYGFINDSITQHISNHRHYYVCQALMIITFSFFVKNQKFNIKRNITGILSIIIFLIIILATIYSNTLLNGKTYEVYTKRYKAYNVYLEKLLIINNNQKILFIINKDLPLNGFFSKESYIPGLVAYYILFYDKQLDRGVRFVENDIMYNKIITNDINRKAISVRIKTLLIPQSKVPIHIKPIDESLIF